MTASPEQIKAAHEALDQWHMACPCKDCMSSRDIVRAALPPLPAEPQPPKITPVEEFANKAWRNNWFTPEIIRVRDAEFVAWIEDHMQDGLLDAEHLLAAIKEAGK